MFAICSSVGFRYSNVLSCIFLLPLLPRNSHQLVSGAPRQRPPDVGGRLLVGSVQPSSAGQVRQQSYSVAAVITTVAGAEVALSSYQLLARRAHGAALPDVLERFLENISAVVHRLPVVAAQRHVAVPVNDQLPKRMMTALAGHALVRRKRESGVVEHLAVSSGAIDLVLRHDVANLHQRARAARPTHVRIASAILRISVVREAERMIAAGSQLAVLLQSRDGLRHQPHVLVVVEPEHVEAG